ncbi:MAG: hypothetical protein RIS26_1046 [Actinomycetota bacterium]
MNQLNIGLGDETVSVAIVDDHEAIRYAVRSACPEFNFNLLADAGTVDECIEKLGDQNPQVAILDLSLGDGSRVDENVSKFVARGVQVLVYSIGDKVNLIRAAVKAGAAAVVTKGQSMEELAKAVFLVSHGVYINNLQTTAAIDSDLEFKDAKLSARERAVLGLYASGLTQKQVAFELGIAPTTVKEFIDRVRIKYANVGRPLTDKTDFLKRAYEDGVLEENA